MADKFTELINQTMDMLGQPVGFGLPVASYHCFGEVDGSLIGEYDFICITECRNCGKLNTTLAQQERGVMMPMSAGTGPQCQGERCGGKVSAMTYSYFKFASAREEELQQDGMKADHLARLAAIIDTADRKKQEAQQRAATKASARQRRIEAFRQSRYEVINPAMKSVGEYLTERGHGYKISLDAPTTERGRSVVGDSYIDMQIFRDGKPGTAASPRIAIYFDRSTNGIREEILDYS